MALYSSLIQASPGPTIKPSDTLKALMKIEQFRRLVERSVDAIGEEYIKHLKNVEIVIEDRPSNRQLQENGLEQQDVLLGLYEGIPLTERENYSLVLPDKITIFKEVIEDIAKDEKEVEKLVADTVWHEIGHHFGLSEKEVRKREARGSDNT